MINAAIVGLGSWGQTLVNSVQERSGKIRFTAAVTRTPAKAEAYAKDKGLALGSDYDAMLADPAIDAVVLATPHSQHADQIAAAADKGKHVFVEKPFTLTKADAERAVAAADKAGIVVALGHNRRFLPAMAELRQRVQSGALGTILHAEGNFSGSGALRYTPDGWRSSRAESPAGGMGAMGIHMVDTLIHLLGPIGQVWCQSFRRAVAVDIDDTTTMLFRFRSGASGYLATLGVTTPTWDVRVFGDKGVASIRQYTHFAFHPLTGDPELIDFPRTDTEKAELEAFADAATGGPAYPLPTGEAVHGIAVLEAIIASAASGQAEAVG